MSKEERIVFVAMALAGVALLLWRFRAMFVAAVVADTAVTNLTYNQPYMGGGFVSNIMPNAATTPGVTDDTWAFSDCGCY